ncbi:hypothetical protein J3Q64DRAFT_1775912 [Phycomyces blakesleeanus]|uniref:FAD synthase n=1 Tax=Phycomyces blakesleeanus TaxID=4837 RepID=A0ABR3AJP4_PHYBL
MTANYSIQTTKLNNDGCTTRQVDPVLETKDKYDFGYIERTVYEFADSDDTLGPQVKEALSVIEQTYKTYGLDATALSFNGGKDCTVLLHLVVAVLSRLHKDRQHLRTVFVTCPNPFPHVDAFVNVCTRRYHLDCIAIPGPMRPALQEFLSCSSPSPKAIFVGIRRNDPYAETLTHFNKTDKGWPDFMRVHPIIDWTYKDIWGFLLKLRIPYCSLYDYGYTSLGSMENTHPNPQLRNESGDGFKPAYMLQDETYERCGRVGSSVS